MEDVTYSKVKQIELTSEELKGINASEKTAAVVAEKVVNGPVHPVVYFVLPFFVLFLLLFVSPLF
jgi:hypothetical protein